MINEKDIIREEVIETKYLTIERVSLEYIEYDVEYHIKRGLENWKQSDNFFEKTCGDLNIDDCEYEVVEIYEPFFDKELDDYCVEVKVKYTEKYSNIAELEDIEINKGD